MSIHDITLGILSLAVILIGLSQILHLRNSHKTHKNLYDHIDKLHYEILKQKMNIKNYKRYKALDDVGVKRTEQYTNWFEDVNPCGREEEWKEQRETYGIDERSTWNWSDDFMDYMYIHLEMFNRVNCVAFDSEYETIEFEGKKITIQQAMDEILDWMKNVYYPDKLDSVDIDNYPMTEEGRKEWQEAIKKFSNEKHRIILLFAEIIEHLNW